MSRRLLPLFFALFLCLPLIAAPLKIGVFIPGQREGSPIYDSLPPELMIASENPCLGAGLRGRFHQAEWQEN